MTPKFTMFLGNKRRKHTKYYSVLGTVLLHRPSMPHKNCQLSTIIPSFINKIIEILRVELVPPCQVARKVEAPPRVTVLWHAAPSPLGVYLLSQQRHHPHHICLHSSSNSYLLPNRATMFSFIDLLCKNPERAIHLAHQVQDAPWGCAGPSLHRLTWLTSLMVLA